MAWTWFAALTDQLARERPSVGLRVVAVAGVLVKYSNPDGTHADVGQRRLAAETCQHMHRVGDALAWLVANRWVMVERRKGGHGADKRTLTVPFSAAPGGYAEPG